MKKESILVFCGSANGNDPIFLQTAEKLGTLIGQQGRKIVYGAGSRGLMGEVSRAAIRNGAYAIGVNLKRFEKPEYRQAVDEYYSTPDLQARKTLMMNKCDACIALPGGIGTLDEIGDALSMLQLGLTNKPLGILNVDGYFDPLMAMFDRMSESGFLQDKHRHIIIADSDPERLLATLDTIE